MKLLHNLWLEGDVKWKVEEVDGEIEMVIFVGHNAKKRSRQYDKWRKEHKKPK